MSGERVDDLIDYEDEETVEQTQTQEIKKGAVSMRCDQARTWVSMRRGSEIFC